MCLELENHIRELKAPKFIKTSTLEKKINFDSLEFVWTIFQTQVAETSETW